jgi:transposase
VIVGRNRQRSPSRVTVRFDKRMHSFKTTKKGNPVLFLRCLDARIGIPIAKDGTYDRLREHLHDGWRMTSAIMTSRLRFYATLSREFEKPEPIPNILGVDVNSSRLAVSIVDPRCRYTGKGN